MDWIIDNDHCHPNDLGHRIVVNRVFEAIARNCDYVTKTMLSFELAEISALDTTVCTTQACREEAGSKRHEVSRSSNPLVRVVGLLMGRPRHWR